MAVNIASEDRLKSFNEIVYSRSTMEKLIDSLALDSDIVSKFEKQAVLDRLRRNISTSSRASDSFEITFYDTDPVRARDGVALLANHFISTRLRLENRRNNETVDFFQAKLNELETVVDEQRNLIVSATAENMKQQPIDQTALQSRLQTIDTQIDELDWQILQEEDKLKILNDFLSQKAPNIVVDPLYKLPVQNIPLGQDLSILLGEYDQMRQQFTDSYPQLRALRTQITEVAKRIPPAIESNLSNLKRLRGDQGTERKKIINNMEKAFIAAQLNNSKQSNFSIYQQLHNEMKIKLEQARMARDIGDKASEQFIVLDPPYVAERPSSPNRRLIVGVGLLIGVVLGGLLAGVAEVLDTTIRRDEDLEFDKPIIAYLADGRA